MKVATSEEHIITEILVGLKVKRATSKKDSGPQSYGLFWKQYRSIPRKQKLL